MHRLSALCRWSAPSVTPRDADGDPAAPRAAPPSLPPRRPTPNRLPSVPSAGLLFDMDTEDGGGGGGGGCPASPSARAASTAHARACARGRPDAAALAALVQPWTPAEADLARQVALAIDAAGGPDPEALARVLRALGHAVTLRSGLGAPAAPAAATPDCLRNLRHSFLAVTQAGAAGSNATLIVDPRYRDQFIVAASTPAYDALLASIPPVFVGCAARVASLTEALCAEMAAAFASRGVALPPWRRPAAMLTKWRPRRSEDVAATSAFAAGAGVPPPTADTTHNAGAARRRASVAEAAAAATARGRPATGPAPAPAALAAARAASLLASQLSSERSGGWVSRRESGGHDHPPPPPATTPRTRTPPPCVPAERPAVFGGVNDEAALPRATPRSCPARPASPVAVAAAATASLTSSSVAASAPVPRGGSVARWRARLRGAARVAAAHGGPVAGLLAKHAGRGPGGELAQASLVGF